MRHLDRPTTSDVKEKGNCPERAKPRKGKKSEVGGNSNADPKSAGGTVFSNHRVQEQGKRLPAARQKDRLKGLDCAFSRHRGRSRKVGSTTRGDELVIGGAKKTIGVGFTVNPKKQHPAAFRAYEKPALTSGNVCGGEKKAAESVLENTEPAFPPPLRRKDSSTLDGRGAADSAISRSRKMGRSPAHWGGERLVR